MGDETGLTIDGHEKILIGPLNLYTVYLAMERMRTLAGFNALHKREKTNPAMSRVTETFG
jgi:hypothetical protein